MLPLDDDKFEENPINEDQDSEEPMAESSPAAESAVEEAVSAPSDEDQSAGEEAMVSESESSKDEEEIPDLVPVMAVEPPASEELKSFAMEEDTAEADQDRPSGMSSEAPDIDDGREWYVVHCYSGYENKVRHNLEQRIETMGMKDEIFDVVVPTEEEIEIKEGKRRSIERRVFPGYILVNMLMSEESWYVVRNTPGVTSFVGMGNEPTPLRPEEVSHIIKRMEADAPRIKVTFRQGERVRIMDGPFNDFRGTVDEIDMERAKVRVMVNFFGRETPVELDFLQVEKA